MSELAFAKWAKEDDTIDLDLNQELETAIQDFYNTTYSLFRLQMTMDGVSGIDRNTTRFNESEIALLKEWAEGKDHLDERWLVTTLLTKDGKTIEEQLGDLVLLSGNVSDSVVYCDRANLLCDRTWMERFISPNHLNCYTYDPSEGQSLVESSAQGIKNGVTFIFLTGSRLLASVFGTQKLRVLPGYKNTFHTSSGSEGIRMIIHSPDVEPYPELDAIDVAPGMATLIGVTSQENGRLENPYGDCFTSDMEEDLLIKSLEAKLSYKPYVGQGTVKSAYSTIQCRNSCLQRYFWEECGCLMASEKMPFFNSSLVCGYVESERLSNSEKYGKGGCWEMENIMNDDCKNILDKLFSDLKCVRRVLEMEDNVPKEDEKNFDCECPVPCFSREYKTTISTSRWPSAGPELDAAYQSIVKDTVIPYFQQLNTSLADGSIGYLSDEKNRYEIMENFARVTVYIKSMRVQRVEQVKAYTVVDLISDIGKKCKKMTL